MVKRHRKRTKERKKEKKRDVMYMLISVDPFISAGERKSRYRIRCNFSLCTIQLFTALLLNLCFNDSLVFSASMSYNSLASLCTVVVHSHVSSHKYRMTRNFVVFSSGFLFASHSIPSAVIILTDCNHLWVFQNSLHIHVYYAKMMIDEIKCKSTCYQEKCLKNAKITMIGIFWK